MKTPSNTVPSPLRRQAVETFRRARKLPPGPHRNDLRQLAFALLHLQKLKLAASSCTSEGRTSAMPADDDRDMLSRRSRQAETAAHINEWRTAPGLASPNRL